MSELVRLRPDVRPIKRARGPTLLVSTDHGGAVRLSPAVEDLLPLLVAGSSVDQLVAELHVRFPLARDVEPKLSTLLAQLRNAGLVNDGSATRSSRWRVRLPNPDGLAKTIASVLARISMAAGVLGCAVLMLSVIGIAATPSTLPRFAELREQFHPLGILLVWAIVMPLHELAHAVACRACGVPVSGAGILFARRLLPSPYIDTSLAYRLTGRRRVMIPLAGPLVDMVALGGWAWIASLTDPQSLMGSVAATAFLFGLVMLYFNTNPLRGTDGSRALEALLDDDLARRSALALRPSPLTQPRTRNIYRIACVAHLLVFAAIFHWVWR